MLNWCLVNRPMRHTRVKCMSTCEKQVKRVKLHYAPLKSVKVAIINSMSNVGKFTNLLLKQDPLISEMRMYCKTPPLGLAADLRGVPTTAKPFAFTGTSLPQALKKADIVLLVGHNEPDDVTSDKEVFKSNTPYIQKIATAVAKNCPDAIVGISVYPVNSTVPLFAEIMRQHGVFCPNKILGVMTQYVMRARCVLACLLGLNPLTVQVQVLGGGTPHTIVPLVTSATPGGHCLESKTEEISSGIANMDCAVWAMNKHPAWLSAAHANALFVHQVAKGLTGKESQGVTFIRNASLYGLKYSSLPVDFGLEGVKSVRHIPKLSKNELPRFDQAIACLLKDIEMGEKAAISHVPQITGEQSKKEVKA